MAEDSNFKHSGHSTKIDPEWGRGWRRRRRPFRCYCEGPLGVWWRRREAVGFRTEFRRKSSRARAGRGVGQAREDPRGGLPKSVPLPARRCHSLEDIWERSQFTEEDGRDNSVMSLRNPGGDVK